MWHLGSPQTKKIIFHIKNADRRIYRSEEKKGKTPEGPPLSLPPSSLICFIYALHSSSYFHLAVWTEPPEILLSHLHYSIQDHFFSKSPLILGQSRQPKKCKHVIYIIFTRVTFVSTAFPNLRKTEPYNLVFTHNRCHNKHTILNSALPWMFSP